MIHAKWCPVVMAVMADNWWLAASIWHEGDDEQAEWQQCYVGSQQVAVVVVKQMAMNGCLVVALSSFYFLEI